MPKIVVVVFAVLVACLSNLGAAEAYVIRCRSGDYLIGLTGMVGAWVDQVRPVCAPFDRATRRFGDTYRPGTAGTSPGGAEQFAVCGGHGAVVAIHHGYARPDDQEWAQNVKLRCADPMAPRFIDAAVPQLKSNDEGTHSIAWAIEDLHTECGGSDVGAGIQGLANGSVESIAIICGPGPGPGDPIVAGSPTDASPPPTGSGSANVSAIDALTGKATGNGGVLGLGGALSGAVAQAPSQTPLFPGSWWMSCTHAKMEGTKLIASCRNKAGGRGFTALDVSTCAQPPSAGNSDGKLVCESGPRKPIVDGSWAMSCTGENMSGTMLIASCRNKAGANVMTALDVSTCAQPPSAGNSDGTLVCESGPRKLAVPGSWAMSCTSEKMQGTMLIASCRNKAGAMMPTVLDVATCNQPPTAGNNDGTLVCESGLASAGGTPPPGTGAGNPPGTGSGNPPGGTGGSGPGSLPLVRVATATNVRSGPGKDYTPFGVLPTGTVVPYDGCQRDWCHVFTAQSDGWVWKKSLAFGPGGSGGGASSGGSGGVVLAPPPPIGSVPPFGGSGGVVLQVPGIGSLQLPGLGSNPGGAGGPPTGGAIGGSWKQSCWGDALTGSVLSAQCKTKTGSTKTSSINVAKCSVPIAVHNDDGNLVCQ